jgi:ArsR family transcriptional regulator
MNQMIEWLKICADENRLRILLMLKNKPLCACELLAVLDITGATLSSHMKLMRLAGIVEQKKEGRWIIYSIRESRIMSLLDFLIENFTDKEQILDDQNKLSKLNLREFICRR